MINGDMRAAFERDGFLLVPEVFSAEEVEAIKCRFDHLFRGDFDTGIYPDEWHWREGISLPDAMREICNGWKSDTVIKDAVLSRKVGALSAALTGWKSVRVAQDSVLWKPPGAKGVGWHQDGSYISDNFVPRENNSITVWCALDDADTTTGVVRYAKGSHKWRHASVGVGDTGSFHAGGGEDGPLRKAADSAGLSYDDVEVESLDVKAGSAVIHHQDTWHGSGPNTSSSRHRRALAIHALRGDVQFADDPKYIYGRYKLSGEGCLRSEFFPFIPSD